MRTRLVLLNAIATCVVLATLTSTAAAQITPGTVSGAVKDGQGLRVPGATVALESESRGTRTAPVVTNATGDFVIPT
jgi:hypothetical protein